MAANRNLLWTEVFVEELARAGLAAVCIAPGSRSTPLTIAFAEHPTIKVYSHLDERSAAFFALGLAQATDQPVAMVCTSGTAAANFYPAIIEAKQSQIPLLVLTADRPHELRESGANQTIDQVKMYGDNVLWAMEVAPPEANPPALTVRSLRTLANRAYAKANGIVKGPVHLNFPFRKPLEKIEVPSDNAEVPKGAEARADDQPFTEFSHAHVRSYNISDLPEIVSAHEKGIIICGINGIRGMTSSVAHRNIERLSEITGYPIFADSLSGARFNLEIPVIGGYDTFINSAAFDSPDIVISFGAVPTSTALNTYLAKITPAYRIQVSRDDIWADDAHHLSHFIQSDPFYFCDALASPLRGNLNRSASNWLSQFRAAESAHWEAMQTALDEEFFDGVVVADVVDHALEDSTIFIGNSLPVRHLDQFGRPQQKHLRVLGNRGASGIDGVVSSALGAAAANPDHRLTLIIGDVSFYHDLNGLLAIKRCGISNVTIVLLNNNGGGIFQRLPIAQFDPPFTEHFLTPHGLEFEPVIRMYGLDYVRADDRITFKRAYQESMAADRPCVIEVRTDVQQDFQHRKAVMEKVNQHIKEAMRNS